MKAKITWDPPETEPGNSNDWPYGQIGQEQKHHFIRGKPLEITDPHIIKKAKANAHYKVEMIDPPDGPTAEELEKKAKREEAEKETAEINARTKARKEEEERVAASKPRARTV